MGKRNEEVPASRSALMSRIRSRDTQPELAVRSLVHSLGYRFRIHVRNLPGVPDLVLPKYRTVIFVHGCFWHQHPGCPRARLPKSRTDYWHPKLKRNTERDREQAGVLRRQGWSVLTVWECETGDTEVLAKRVTHHLRARLKRIMQAARPGALRGHAKTGG